jgi:hypothetical protein
MSQLTCKVCGHSLRPSRAKASDYPGTRRSYGGKCKVCYYRGARSENRGTLSDEALAQREKAKNATHCSTCGVPLRSNQRLEDAPGTRRAATYGKCTTCYSNRGQLSGNSFVENEWVAQLNRLTVPKVGEREYRMVRRLIEDRFEGDDYLLSVLGLVGEDTE